jgi:signal peptidase II
MENFKKLDLRIYFLKILKSIHEFWLDYLILLLIAIVFISLDQWTKSLVRVNLQPGEEWLPKCLRWLMPYARIRYWYNTGAAFGLFQGGSLIFTILAFIVAGFILYYFPHIPRKDRWLRLALIMQFSGAIGNLIDRLRYAGKVTDFISLGNFAIFNVADSCITVGTIILILGVYLSERADKRKKLIIS